MTKDPDSPSTQRINTTVNGSTDSPTIKPMPPEFQLRQPRRVRWSTFATEPNSEWAHMSGFKSATPEQEAWHRINDPEGGLHLDDLTAYRESQRSPVAGFFARLKFWR